MIKNTMNRVDEKKKAEILNKLDIKGMQKLDNQLQEASYTLMNGFLREKEERDNLSYYLYQELMSSDKEYHFVTCDGYKGYVFIEVVNNFSGITLESGKQVCSGNKTYSLYVVDKDFKEAKIVSLSWYMKAYNVDGTTQWVN